MTMRKPRPRDKVRGIPKKVQVARDLAREAKLRRLVQTQPTVQQHYKYEPGDQIQDLTFDPPMNGVVTGKHEQSDAYYVRINGGFNDVIIHARNLKKV